MRGEGAQRTGENGEFTFGKRAMMKLIKGGGESRRRRRLPVGS